jgi:alkylation response protein AidB-like acyl-CoA dehydrogenase
LPTDPIGLALLAPVLAEFGTEEQRAFFLPRLVSGEHRWAQGFSEPEAGSDLFALRTRARRAARRLLPMQVILISDRGAAASPGQDRRRISYRISSSGASRCPSCGVP